MDATHWKFVVSLIACPWITRERTQESEVIACHVLISSAKGPLSVWKKEDGELYMYVLLFLVSEGLFASFSQINYRYLQRETEVRYIPYQSLVGKKRKMNFSYQEK